MLISPINTVQQQNFGHTFKVSICLKNAGGKGYDFINPYSNKKLYKQLNSKLVGWFNENFFTNLRTLLEQPLKRTKTKNFNELWNKTFMIRALHKIDSDYRQLNLVRSVYDKSGLGYIATGVDVPIIENLKGAKKIGIAKASSISGGGKAHNPYIDDLIKDFQSNAAEYVKDNRHLLRSKNGKEIMLRVNFRTAGKNKKGQEIYELENADFYEIKKSMPLSKEELENIRHKESGLSPEIERTIQHHITKIAGKEAVVDMNRILNQPLPKLHNPKVTQLELKFKD